jgi:hypothetical protein
VREQAQYPGGPNAPDKIKSPYGQGFTRNAAYSFARKVNEADRPAGPNQHREDRDDIEYSGSRNRRSVWTIATSPYSGYSGAHFATYPPALVEPCIKAGTSDAGCCSICGKAWERVTAVDYERLGDISPTDKAWDQYQGNHKADRKHGRARKLVDTLGFAPACVHDAPAVPCIVFDPFNGSGTTGLVAQQLNRRYVGLDLSAVYLELAKQRIGLTALDEWTNGKTAGQTLDGLPLFGAQP